MAPKWPKYGRPNRRYLYIRNSEKQYRNSKANLGFSMITSSKSVPKWLRLRSATRNSNIVAQTGNSYISGKTAKQFFLFFLWPRMCWRKEKKHDYYCMSFVQPKSVGYIVYHQRFTIFTIFCENVLTEKSFRQIVHVGRVNLNHDILQREMNWTVSL